VIGGCRPLHSGHDLRLRVLARDGMPGEGESSGGRLEWSAAKFKGDEVGAKGSLLSKDSVGHILDDPHISFAFCYPASHFALDLVDEKVINEIMEHIETHRKELAEAISKNG
jgi:hypothetical protein